jgi:hypothetical protein
LRSSEKALLEVEKNVQTHLKESHMQHTKALRDVLSKHLPWHAARLDFTATFLLALIRNKTVNFVPLSLDIDSEAKAESSYRRIQRFFKDFILEGEAITQL